MYFRIKFGWLEGPVATSDDHQPIRVSKFFAWPSTKDLALHSHTLHHLKVVPNNIFPCTDGSRSESPSHVPKTLTCFVNHIPRALVSPVLVLLRQSQPRVVFFKILFPGCIADALEAHRCLAQARADNCLRHLYPNMITKQSVGEHLKTLVLSADLSRSEARRRGSSVRKPYGSSEPERPFEIFLAGLHPKVTKSEGVCYTSGGPG
eukprot:1178721-Prorocentrum_minimum.AAC.1